MYCYQYYMGFCKVKVTRRLCIESRKDYSPLRCMRSILAAVHWTQYITSDLKKNGTLVFLKGPYFLQLGIANYSKELFKLSNAIFLYMEIFKFLDCLLILQQYKPDDFANQSLSYVHTYLPTSSGLPRLQLLSLGLWDTHTRSPSSQVRMAYSMVSRLWPSPAVCVLCTLVSSTTYQLTCWLHGSWSYIQVSIHRCSPPRRRRDGGV